MLKHGNQAAQDFNLLAQWPYVATFCQTPCPPAAAAVPSAYSADVYAAAPLAVSQHPWLLCCTAVVHLPAGSEQLPALLPAGQAEHSAVLAQLCCC